MVTREADDQQRQAPAGVAVPQAVQRLEQRDLAAAAIAVDNQNLMCEEGGRWAQVG